MKITVKKDRIVCTLDNRNTDFWWSIREYFHEDDGSEYCRAWLCEVSYEDYRKSDDLKIFINRLTRIIASADRFGVEVGEDVRQHLERLKGIYSDLLAAEQRAKEAYAKELLKQEQLSRWKYLCEHGCERCSNLRKAGDDYVCAELGAYLKEKIIGEYIGSTYYPFVLKAYPAENCPYKPILSESVNAAAQIFDDSDVPF